jgi:hypothetical protein
MDDDLRWRNKDEHVASKKLRKSAAVRIHAPSSTLRCDKSNSRAKKSLRAYVTPEPDNIASTSCSLSGVMTEQSNSGKYTTTVDMPAHSSLAGSFRPTSDVLPSSSYEERQLLFKMSYCNGASASNAARKIQEKFPVHRGDLLWLLDQFLLMHWPQGCYINCADPLVFPDADSVWSNYHNSVAILDFAFILFQNTLAL